MNRKTIGVVFAVTILTACLPLFTLNCIGGHDIAYHLLRIDALKTGILNGLPFLRVNMLYFDGMGYASSMFYPDFLLYFPAALRALGVGINQSYHLFVFFCIAAGFLSAYFGMNCVTKDRLASLICAVVFVLYRYFLDDIYTRSAVGEFTAMIFLPLIFAGLYDLIFEDFARPYLLGAGMCGVILCHTLTTFLCVLLCVCAVLLCVKRLLKSPGKLVRLFLTAAAVLALTAFYWIPMLEQMLSSSFQFSNSIFDLNYEKMLLKDIFYNRHPAMGLAVFLLLLPRLFVKKKTDPVRFADLCTLAAFLLTLGSTGLVPWGRLQDVLSFIQFPWRLFVLTGPLFAFSAGIYWMGFREELPEALNIGDFTDKALICLVLAAMIVSAAATQSRNDQKYYSYSDDYFSYAPFTGNVLGGEWLPAGAGDRAALIADTQTAFLSDGSGSEVTRNKNTLSVTGLSPDLSWVDVPFLYYKGYRAVSGDGKELLTDGTGENGRVRVYPEGAGEIRVFYGGTTVQKVSDLISVLTLTGLGAWLIFLLRRKRKAAVS